VGHAALEQTVAHSTRAGAESCAAAGWAWILRHLGLFAPADPFNPDDMQRIVELALLYGYTRDWSGEPAAVPPLRPVEDFLRDFLTDPVLAQYARKRPVLFSPYFLAYLAMRPLGWRLPGYEDGLVAAGRAGYPDALETTPYRELEMRHMMWKAGLRPRRPDCAGAYPGTVLARNDNPVHLNIPTVYSITHTLFYLTDYCGPADVMPPAERDRAVDVVECLFAHYWRKRDWDLVGELGLNLVSLDRYDTPLFTAGVGELLAAWTGEPDGALPGRNFKPEDADSEPDYRFTHAYHTTLVGTLFCLAYLHRTHNGGPR